MADSGTDSGYMGLSVHLAGKPFALRLKQAQIVSVVVNSGSIGGGIGHANEHSMETGFETGRQYPE